MLSGIDAFQFRFKKTSLFCNFFLSLLFILCTVLGPIDSLMCVATATASFFLRCLTISLNHGFYISFSVSELAFILPL